jgi:branched-chain amino acid transport system permease protein
MTIGPGAPIVGESESRRRTRARRTAIGATLGGGLLAGATAPFLDISLLSLAATMAMYVVLAQGWNILGGYVGYLSLGTVAFVGVGGYTTGMLAYHLDWPPFAGVPVGGIVAVVIALVLAGPTLRLRGAYFAIMTLIITFIVQSVVLNWPPTLGAVGIFLQPLTRDPRLNEAIFFYIFLVLAVLMTLVVLVLQHSRMGDALRAVREDEDAASVLGIDTVRSKVIAFVAGAGIAGVVGGVYAHRLTYVEPAGMFDVALSINVVVMVVLGGAGSWIGPLIGAPAVLALAEFFRVAVTRIEVMGEPLPIELNRLALGAIIVVLALFAPRGVVGIFRRTRGRSLGV